MKPSELLLLICSLVTVAIVPPARLECAEEVAPELRVTAAEIKSQLVVYEQSHTPDSGGAALEAEKRAAKRFWTFVRSHPTSLLDYLIAHQDERYELNLSIIDAISRGCSNDDVRRGLVKLALAWDPNKLPPTRIGEAFRGITDKRTAPLKAELERRQQAVSPTVLSALQFTGDPDAFDSISKWVMKHPRGDALQALYNLDRRRARPILLTIKKQKKGATYLVDDLLGRYERNGR